MTPLDTTITAFTQLIQERDKIIEQLFLDKQAILAENIKLTAELIEEKQKRLAILSNNSKKGVLCNAESNLGELHNTMLYFNEQCKYNK